MPARVHAGMSFMSGLHVKGLLVPVLKRKDISPSTEAVTTTTTSVS